MSDAGEAPRVDSATLEAVQARTVERYRSRFREHGVSALSLGWGSPEHQRVRFEAAAGSIESIDLAGRTLLDYGCGFADLLAWLVETGQAPERYVGVDVNPDFIEVARGRFPEGRSPHAEFHVNDMAVETEGSWSADVVVMLGLLNFKQPNVDNEAFARRMMKLAFGWASECLVCDFLSTEPTPGYEVEDWVNYYSPGRVLEWALELSPWVSLHHDYEPIPQRESLVVIRKRAR